MIPYASQIELLHMVITCNCH
uniref:Uncharacterized protein n=1 Tax=Rhizophora mucronata TaxID=61149 RepID=A0A2P2Q0M2_RHIMU